MSSEERLPQPQGSLLNLSGSQSMLTHAGYENDEELVADDLEVAMINESFEQQMKHSLLFANPNLRSIFYAAAPVTITNVQKKQSPDLGIDDAFDFKMDVTPPLQLLPPITPPSDKEFDRGQQLDKELEQMMLEGEENYMLFDSPVTALNTSQALDHGDLHHSKMSFCSINSVPSFPLSANLYSSFDSQLADQQDLSECECADAAEAIAFDVVSSLFADEHKDVMDPFSDDDDESMVINPGILQVLQDEDTVSEVENDDPKNEQSVSKCAAYNIDDGNANCKQQQSPSSPSLYSMQTISSPVSNSDEQTVPVIDSWEELEDSPVTAEKVYSEAKAVLQKLRAERKAIQL